MWPFKVTKSATDLMEEAETAKFVEALRRMALTCRDGRMTNHGLSVYGADMMIKEGGKPGPLDQRVLLEDGTFITFEEYKIKKLEMN